MNSNLSLKGRCWLAAMLVCAMAVSVADGAETKSEPRAAGPNPYDILDMALKDKRYLARQLKCILGEANCDQVGNRLKSYAPLVLRGSCPASKCSQQDIRQIQTVLSHVQRNFPKEWNRILKLYTTGY